jgi:hypothetical protein
LPGQGAIGGTIKHAVLGGTASALGGGKFANGARTAAFGYLFNEAAHGASRAWSRTYRYGSRDELLTALGTDGYTFGKRPLEGTSLSIRGADGSGLDMLNVEVLHEQVFYVDADGKPQNRGFFPDGVRADGGFPSNIGTYRFGPVLQGPLTTQQLQSMPGFRPQDYSLMRNNCQDFCSAVRNGR